MGGSKLRDYGDPYSANVILPKQLLIETIKSAVSTDAGPGVEDRQALAERMMLALDEGYEGFGWRVFESGRSARAGAQGDAGQVAARLLQRSDGADQRRRADLLHDQGDHEPARAVARWSSTSGTSTSPTTAPTRSTSRRSGGPIAWCTSCGSTRSRCRSTAIDDAARRPRARAATATCRQRLRQPPQRRRVVPARLAGRAGRRRAQGRRHRAADPAPPTSRRPSRGSSASRCRSAKARPLRRAGLLRRRRCSSTRGSPAKRRRWRGAHAATLERLPATVHAFDPVELAEVADAVRRRARLPARAAGAPHRPAAGRARRGCSRRSRASRSRRAATASRRAPRPRFQDEAQAVLRKRRLLAGWRQEVDAVFQAIQPALDARLLSGRRAAPPDRPDSTPAPSPCRPTSCGAASGAAASASRWRSTARAGRTRSCAACSVSDAADAAGVGAVRRRRRRRRRHAARCLDRRVARGAARPYQRGGRRPRRRARVGAGTGATSTGLSYDRLRGYRDELTRALYEQDPGGVESPQAFAAYARSLRIAPRPGALRYAPDVVQAFVRDVFLTGNGTLFVNNTFVEWAAVQAHPPGRAAPARGPLRRPRQAEAVQQPAAVLAAARLGPDPADRGSGRLVRRRRAAVALRLAERREERRPTASARCTSCSPKASTRCSAIRSGAEAGTASGSPAVGRPGHPRRRRRHDGAVARRAAAGPPRPADCRALV